LKESKNNKGKTAIKVMAEIVIISVNAADLLHFIHYNKDK
jgi:hypothetical protein